MHKSEFVQVQGQRLPESHFQTFLFGFYIRQGFENKSDVFYVLCEDFFMLDATHSQVDVETKVGVYH